MCDLTIDKPLNSIKPSQISEMTSAELLQVIQTGSPNYIALQAMATELASRCEHLEQSQAA